MSINPNIIYKIQISRIILALRFQLRSDLHSRFMGSMLGAYWALVNPILQVTIYVFLFSIIFPARISGSNSPYDYALFCLSGLGAWLSIQEALTNCASSIVKNSAIVKNIDYPIVLFPLSSVICSFVTIGTTYSLLLILRSITGHPPSATLLALPFVLLVQGIFVFGIGLYLSMIGTFFRDTLQVLPMIMQLIMLATPVIYERKDVPAKLLFLIDYNPIYYLIDSYRKILFYGHWPDWLPLCIVGFIGLVFTFIALKLFNSARGYFEAVV